MAITPNKRRDRQLKELDKLLDEHADYLEGRIDKELGETSESPANTISVLLSYVPDSRINALSQKPSIMEDVRQRYIEKGWKDVKFRYSRGSLHEDLGVYYSGSIKVILIPPGVGVTTVPDFVKVILGVVSILLLGLLIKSCLG